jgi:hypothetical protein
MNDAMKRFFTEIVLGLIANTLYRENLSEEISSC